MADIPERIFAWANNDEDEYWDGVWMAHDAHSFPSQPDAEYICADLLARAIQTALEMAADRVDRQYLPTRIGGDLICDPVQGEASADAIRAIRVEDVVAKMENTDD